MWTLFWDMYSGGGTKEGDYERIYIEASMKEATIIFYNRFGHNPNRVTCTCCGEDYSVEESETFSQASGYHRGCDYDGNKYVNKASKDKWKKYFTIKEYKEMEEVLVIGKDDIKDSERIGEVPEEGYVWV